ncbi:Clavaminate synthase-like protein [Peniophora sp. CONT]|nr:Clavaminate synthase-like protein [Peniophora sp. CONT]
MTVKEESPAAVNEDTDVEILEVEAEQSEPSASTAEERCPACTEGVAVPEEKENWVRCDACKVWFHWRCVAVDGQELSQIDKWFCEPCRALSPKHRVTLKPPARKSTRRKPVRDYANLNNGVTSDASKWSKMLNSAALAADAFPRMQGSDVNAEWLERDEDALTVPVLIERPEGLGMDMPDESLTVKEIADMLGEDTSVEVIDVASQSGLSGWTLGKWAEYYHTPISERDKVRNVISLEISGTKLAEKVLPPRIVRELDWVEKFWPANKKGKGAAWPKVQLYCLMGTQDSWTDWHIDFAGSSVYYHILKGAKTFLFIKPTPANLAAYERWSGSEMQTNTWLGDLVDEVMKVELTAGNTMIIPTGWIHAVYTPKDALVFGGNFLHSYDVAKQLRVREIEIATRVPKKFRFPYFIKLSWYVAESYLRSLRAKEDFPPRVLSSIESLSTFLVSQARVLERGNEGAKKEAREQVPADKVKDAGAVARELRWRVRLAKGVDSDGEEHHESEHLANPVGRPKRKRVITDEGMGGAQFRNFQPKSWDAVVASSKNVEETRVKARPEAELAQDSEWMDVEGEGDEKDRAVVSRREVVTVKARKTPTGLERHRVTSVLETWRWDTVA